MLLVDVQLTVVFRNRPVMRDVNGKRQKNRERSTGDRRGMMRDETWLCLTWNHETGFKVADWTWYSGGNKPYWNREYGSGGQRAVYSYRDNRLTANLDDTWITDYQPRKPITDASVKRLFRVCRKYGMIVAYLGDGWYTDCGDVSI